MLRKILSVFEAFEEGQTEVTERKEGDRHRVPGDNVRLELILNTFNNIGEIIFFDETKVVVTDPIKFRERIVEDIIDHEIIEKGKLENENSLKIQDALYKGLFLKKSLENENTDLDREEIARILQENQSSQAQILKDSSLEDQQSLTSKGLYFQVFETEDDGISQKNENEHFWSLLEATGLGVRITPLATFIPLLISEKAEVAIQEAARSFRRVKRKLNFTIRYDIQNLAGNSVDFFHELTKIVVKEFRLDVCYSRNIEKRTSNCLVSAISGKTGLYVHTDEDQCLLCLDETQGPKIKCPVCQRSRLHVHCSQGLQKCLNCQAGVTFEEAAKEETAFLFSQYQKWELGKNSISVVIEFSNDDQDELTRAIISFDQKIEETARQLKCFVTSRIGCSNCRNPEEDILKANIDSCEHFHTMSELSTQRIACLHCGKEIFSSDLNTSLEGNLRNFEKLRITSKQRIFLNGGLKITKKRKSEPFELRGRLARSIDFDKVASHLRSVEKILLIGPILELELPSPEDVVPDGILMSPAHLLTVPVDQFRGTLDNDGDVHYVLKITKVGEEFTVKKYPNTGVLDDKFCLEADFHGESLCYVTTGILYWFGAGQARCNHSAIKSFQTIHDTRKCPQTSNALNLFGLCEGSTETFEKSILTRHNTSLEMQWRFNIEPSLTTVCRIKTTLGNKTTEFDVTHELLCKYNGVLLVGSLPSEYPEIDCKEIDFCNIEFVALEKTEPGEFKQRLRVVKHFRCEHAEECSKKNIKALDPRDTRVLGINYF